MRPLSAVSAYLTLLSRTTVVSRFGRNLISRPEKPEPADDGPTDKASQIPSTQVHTRPTELSHPVIDLPRDMLLDALIYNMLNVQFVEALPNELFDILDEEIGASDKGLSDS